MTSIKNVKMFNDDIVIIQQFKIENPIVREQQLLVSNESFAGGYDFEVFFNNGRKSNWAFSTQLNKLYTVINQNCLVDFKWSSMHSGLFYVRATAIYSEAQYAQDPVYRCISHCQKSDGSNFDVPKRVWKHVVRCQHPRAIYKGNADEKERLSVVVPMGQPQPGDDTVKLMFVFVCKNSCTYGMNRRPIQIVFTLEDEMANILGRRTVNVRICSCPKRDKNKEERERQQVPVSRGRPPAKRKSDEPDDTPEDKKIYHVDVQVVGRKNACAVLRYAHDLMAGEMLRTGQEKLYKSCISAINQEIQS